LSGLWFWSCTVSNCKNVLVKSTPGVVDEDDEVVDDEDVVAGVEAIAGAGWSICSSEACTICPPRREC
jgi:hypothetical protein